VGVDVEFGGVRPKIASRGLGGFLHYVAKLTCERETAATGKKRRLDKQNLAAHFRPGHSGRHTGRKFFASLFGKEPATAKVFLYVLCLDCYLIGRALGYTESNFSRQVSNCSLKLTNAGLTRVSRSQ